jgi:hypothetical protein
METRVCKQCKIEKSVDNFGKLKNKLNGEARYRSKCAECRNIENAEYYKVHREEIVGKKDPVKIKLSHRKYYDNNREGILVQKREYNKKNKDVMKIKRSEYYLNNREEIVVKNSEYKKKNRSRVNERVRERRKNDPVFRIRETVRSLVKKALAGKKKGSSINKYLPYTFDQLMQNLASQFEPWMNENNHGKYDTKTWNDNDPSTWKWQLDHIIPQSDLPYTSMTDDNFQRCWALENLRPYSAKQNIKDGPRRTRHRRAKS